MAGYAESGYPQEGSGDPDQKPSSEQKPFSEET